MKLSRRSVFPVVRSFCACSLGISRPGHGGVQMRPRCGRTMQEMLQDWACQAQSLGRKIDTQLRLNHLNPQWKKVPTSSELDQKIFAFYYELSPRVDGSIRPRSLTPG